MKLYKFIIVILCIILVSVIVFFIFNKDIIFKNKKNYISANFDETSLTDEQKEILNNISMTIENNSLTPTSATLIIKDNNKYNNENEGFWFGKWYRIDKYNKKNKEWEELQIKDNILFDDLPMRGKYRILTMDMNWEIYYGKLEKGKYRIVKEVIGEYYTEFTIE